MDDRAINESTIFKHENVPRQYQKIPHECDQVTSVLNSMTPVLNNDALLNRAESKSVLGVFNREMGSTTAHTGNTMLNQPTGDELKDCWSPFDHGVNEEGTHHIWK